MSTEKLSKPVAWTSARSLDVRRKITAFTDVGSATEYASANCWEKIVPLYSQEYVSALLAELKSSQAIANEYQQLMYHMDAGGDFYEFQRDKVMKEQSNG